MTKAFLIFGGAAFLAWAITLTVVAVQYEREVGGHLKLAADANSTELAERKLSLAVEGITRRGLCNEGGDNCFTSVIYRTPDEDVGYWRENIANTLADLQAMSDAERADNLIESNQLMKVRETLLDSGSNGDEVTAPKGISRYPANLAYSLWGVLSIVTVTLAMTGFMVPHESERQWWQQP